MKYFFGLIGIIFCGAMGMLFHAYQKEWIILMLPHQTIQTTDSPQEQHTTCVQKTITLYFFAHEQWHKEQTTIIWSADAASTVKTITNCWLTLLEDEKIIDSDTQLISAVITPAKELFLSFNKDLCNPQDATYKKLMIIHALLKTLHENKMPIQSVRLLVHHQTLNDDHLNFSISWPITGYVQLPKS